ncbi:MAG TPA: hypothetical protein VLE03_09720 [Nitrospiraceae bacterium]|nr:hypothetical protein [Nitrospiraceae bacterium]
MNQGKDKSIKTTRVTTRIDSSLIALARTAVLQTRGLTLASLTATGMRMMISRLERERGRRFRPQVVRLLSGRPRKDGTKRKSNVSATRRM